MKPKMQPNEMRNFRSYGISHVTVLTSNDATLCLKLFYIKVYKEPGTRDTEMNSQQRVELISMLRVLISMSEVGFLSG